MRKNLIPLLMIVLVMMWTVLACGVMAQAQEITPAGERLSKMLDQMDVEHNWLPKEGIDWKNGQTDRAERPMTSHCSGFVAGAAYKMDVYILRPPEHRQVLLANAQYDWLEKSGAEYGWRAVATPAEAQALANQGMLVVAACKNPKANRPGHIAVVRPSNKPMELIKTEGPEIIQAGMHNYNSVSLKKGFKNHPEAWVSDTDYAVKFYAHAIEI